MLRVFLGNAFPQEVSNGGVSRVDIPGPTVTYINLPQGNAGRITGLDREDSWDDETFAAKDAEHLAANEGAPIYGHPVVHNDSLFPNELTSSLAGVTNTKARRLILEAWLSHASGVRGLPGHEAFVAIAHPLNGAWAFHAKPGTDPTWVEVLGSDVETAKSLRKFLAEFYGCPEGTPKNLEDTHYTQYGTTVYSPGSAPDPLSAIKMLHTNAGRDIQAVQQFGFAYLGTTGTASASGTTSLTGSTETGVTHLINDAAYQYLVITAPVGDAGKYALIKSNTTGTTPVYTVDRWYTPATPGGAAAATPSATSTYVVVTGGPPAQFVGLTADGTGPASGDTTLPSEITTSGGGLIRKITTNSHSAGATTVVQTTVFTANGTDSLPVTVAKAGESASITAGATNSYQTAVSPTATLSANGDQLTLTWTYTMT